MSTFDRYAGALFAGLASTEFAIGIGIPIWSWNGSAAVSIGWMIFMAIICLTNKSKS